MNELFLGFLIISISFIGLALGLIMRSKPIKGSCGGMANPIEGSECQICGRSDPANCNN